LPPANPMTPSAPLMKYQTFWTIFTILIVEAAVDEYVARVELSLSLDFLPVLDLGDGLHRNKHLKDEIVQVRFRRCSGQYSAWRQAPYWKEFARQTIVPDRKGF
jgi:hypothetical protein